MTIIEYEQRRARQDELETSIPDVLMREACGGNGMQSMPRTCRVRHEFAC